MRPLRLRQVGRIFYMTYKKIGVVDAKSNTPNGTDGLNSELEASSAVAKVRKSFDLSPPFQKKVLPLQKPCANTHIGVNSTVFTAPLVKVERFFCKIPS